MEHSNKIYEKFLRAYQAHVAPRLKQETEHFHDVSNASLNFSTRLENDSQLQEGLVDLKHFLGEIFDKEEKKAKAKKANNRTFDNDFFTPGPAMMKSRQEFKF